MGATRFTRWLVVLAVATIATGCGGDGPREPVRGVSDVSVTNGEFQPEAIEVPAGTEVVWSFEDEMSHDVTGEGWGSEAMTTGAFSHTFEKAGRYEYRCSLHPGMEGEVIVSG